MSTPLSFSDPLLWRYGNNHILTLVALGVLGLFLWKKYGLRFAITTTIWVVFFHESVWGLLYTLRYSGPWYWIAEYGILIYCLQNPRIFKDGRRALKYTLPCIAGFAIWYAIGLPVVFKPSFYILIATSTQYLNSPFVNFVEIAVWLSIIIPFFFFRRNASSSRSSITQSEKGNIKDSRGIDDSHLLEMQKPREFHVQLKRVFMGKGQGLR